MKPSFEVHQLEEFEEAGYPPSIEYFLPVAPMHKDVLFPAWLVPFSKMDPKEAHREHRKRWARFRKGLMADVVASFDQYKPRSILMHGEEGWLLCMREETATHASAMLLFSEPISRTVVTQLLKKESFPPEDLATALCVLSGVREEFPPSGGEFFDVHRGLNLAAWMEGHKDKKGYRKWLNALCLFNSKGGDIALVDRSGQVTWLTVDTQPFKRIGTVPDFVSLVADHLRNGWAKFDGYGDKLIFWPFDSYGVPGRRTKMSVVWPDQ